MLQNKLATTSDCMASTNTAGSCHQKTSSVLMSVMSKDCAPEEGTGQEGSERDLLDAAFSIGLLPLCSAHDVYWR